ncbi:MAG: sulfurtransferase TusA family protein [Magnetococcus sp. WYHC-3]
MKDTEGLPTVDARHLLCPLPLLRIGELARTLPAGGRARVIATDPGLQRDLPVWCRVNGFRLEGIEQRGRELIGTISRPASAEQP